MTGPATARVVLVDDAREFRQLLAIYLEAHDISVAAEADDGASGFAAVVEHDPDLVVTDFEMPGMDGLWLASRLASLRPDVPVVMATNSAGIHALEDGGHAAGVTALVSKRGGPVAIVAAVLEVLGGNAA